MTDDLRTKKPKGRKSEDSYRTETKPQEHDSSPVDVNLVEENLKPGAQSGKKNPSNHKNLPTNDPKITNTETKAREEIWNQSLAQKS